MNNKTIEVQNLTKLYGGFTAVNDISFDVKEGEIFGFLGPNGAGKSTTIQMLSGLSRPSSGKCTVLGQNTYRSKDIYNKMGIVFEENTLYKRLSGKQNLKFFSSLYSTDLSYINELLNKFGLKEAESKLVGNYSKGMKQKLLICRALLNDPEVIILDEPTSGLDIQSAELIRNAIKRFSLEGKTVFLSTHYMKEADDLCDRIAIINKGQIVALDTPNLLKKEINKSVLEVKVENGYNQLLLEKEVSPEGKLMRNSNHSIIELLLDRPNLGEKLNFIKNNCNVINIKTKETSLNEVFKKIVEKS